MKLLTFNFLTCAVRTCKSTAAAFPLHVKDAELEIVEVDFQPEFLRNVLPRLDIGALHSVAGELGLAVPDIPDVGLDEEKLQDGDVEMEAADRVTSTMEDLKQDATDDEETRWRKLHRLLLETQIETGSLVCGNCGHEYKILEGIPNFLLPPHLV